MKMPKKVVVGTQTWEIVERSRTNDGMLSEDNFGYTLQKDNKIFIDVDISPSRKRQTLLHELFHAVRFTMGGYSAPKKSDDVDTWEHYFIAMYEEGMLSVLQNNPEVLSFLLEKE
jgi:hypothetical protein